MAPTGSAVKGMVVCDVRLGGKTAIVTGANTGIGYETALELAGRGARVILACRNLEKGEEAKLKIRETVKDANLIVKSLNLASLKSVREFAIEINESEEKLDILINNAGIMACPYAKTEEGYEMQMGTNHLGHFLLTQLLLDLLKKSAPSRIVIVSSMVYKMGSLKWDDMMSEKKYDPVAAYGASKLANIHHCLELSRRLEGTGVNCYVLHPGVIKTNLQRHLDDMSHLSFGYKMMFKVGGLLMTRFMLTPKQGAQTTIYCAIAPELADKTGKYYSNCAEEALKTHALNKEDAERLWRMSEEWVKLSEAVLEQQQQLQRTSTGKSKSQIKK